MAAANLAQYYTGQNMALPSVADRATAYSGYGLGGGYTGTASQNAALLSKLQAGSPSAAASNAGGYSQVPTGNPQPVSSDPGINDVVDLANKQAGDLQSYNQGLADSIKNAYQEASGSVASGGTGLTDAAAAMNKIQDALNGSQNASAAVLPQTIQAAQGTFANNGQVTTQAGTNNIPYAEQVAQLSANLVPAENAYTSAQQATSARVAQVNAAAALQAAGFTQAQQLQLQALQAKVARGEALTDEEFQRESQLQAAHVAASAQVAAAQTSAGATLGAANTNAQAALKAAALQYPGSQINTDSNGNFYGSTYLQNPVSQSNPATSLQGSGATFSPDALNGVISKYLK